MTHPTDSLRLVPSRITPEMAHALESNFAECTPPSPIHAENWQKAWSKCLAAAPASPLPEGGGQCSGISGELSGWQDLNSAPRDGHEFQAWWKGTWQPRARFDPEYGSFQLWGRTDFDTEGWEVFEIDGFWQPQPAAPTGAK